MHGYGTLQGCLVAEILGKPGNVATDLLPVIRATPRRWVGLDSREDGGKRFRFRSGAGRLPLLPLCRHRSTQDGRNSTRGKGCRAVTILRLSQRPWRGLRCIAQFEKLTLLVPDFWIVLRFDSRSLFVVLLFVVCLSVRQGGWVILEAKRVSGGFKPSVSASVALDNDDPSLKQPFHAASS